MLWKDRLLSALLAVAVSAAATAAVVRFSPEKPELTPGQLKNGVTYEATGVASDEIVASVDGNGAPAELYAFWLGSECRDLENRFGIDVSKNWDMAVEDGKTLRDFVREDTLTAIKQQLVLENLVKEYGVTLSAEDEAQLAAERQGYIERFGGEDKYLAELYKLGISDEGFLRLSRTDYLYRALYELYLTPGSALYADEDTLRAYAVAADWITADHILLMTVDPQTRAPLDDDAVAQKRELAEDLLWRLRDSRDPVALFAELADEYSEDTGRAAYPDGYTFTHGTMADAFDAAARALEENEYSDVVESEYGYHIILRRPLDVEEAVEDVRDEYFGVLFLGKMDRAELAEGPALERMDAETIYAALKAAQAGEEAQTEDAAQP